MVVRYARNLAVLPNYRTPPRLIPAPNYAPWQRTAQLYARAGDARPKGKYSRGRMALAPIRARRIFPATGGGWPGPLPVFIQLTFTSHAAFFDSFLGSKKESYPRPPSSPAPSPHQIMNTSTGVAGGCHYAGIALRPARTR